MSLIYKILFLLFLSIASANAAERVVILDINGCFYIAKALEASAKERDAGKSLSSLIKELSSIENLIPELKYLIQKELNKVFGVYASLPPEKIGGNFFSRCVAVEGSVNKLNKDDTKI